MKKLFFTAILVIATATSVNAQWKVGANFGVQIPLGDLYGGLLDPGVGFDVKGEYLITEHIGAGIDIGYSALGYKMGIGNANLMSIAANGTYYFMTGKFKPYAGIDLGTYMLGSMGGDENKFYFGFAPVAGAQYYFTKRFGANLNVKYNFVVSGENAGLAKIPNFSTIGVNVGVVYTIN